MGLNGEGAAVSRRRRGLEAALLLAAAVVFGEVCSLPLELAARARVAGAAPGGVLPLWVSVDLAVWSRWSRWLGVASLWALGLASVRALRAARVPEPWPLAGGGCLVWSGPIGFGATAGMESAANAALLVVACSLWMESLGDGGGAEAGDEDDEGDEGDESEAHGGGGSGASRPSWRSARTWAPIVTAALPLARPENGALTLLAALVLLGGRRRRLPSPRWTGAAVLVPGIVLAWCHWGAAGIGAP